MGLDCIPKPYPCEQQNHRFAHYTPDGKVDCDLTECPFKGASHPRGMLGTWCWFRGKAAALALAAIGEEALADRAYENLNSKQAAEYGQKLLDLASRLRGYSEGLSPKKHARRLRWHLTFDAKGKQWVAKDDFRLSEILEILEAGGHWYQKIAGYGCSVAVWY